MLDDNQVLNAREAARFIGVAVSTLAKMRCLGGSPAFVKAGRKVLYRRCDLIEWLIARRVRNTTQSARLPRRVTDGLPSAGGP